MREDLHDAVLVALHLDWQEGTCVAELKHGTWGACALRFSAVSGLTIPRAQPWGPSAAILAFTAAAHGAYAFEMQSGDRIDIRAGALALVGFPEPDA